MEYYLKKATLSDFDKILEYKLKTIFDYTNELSQEEKDKIVNYSNEFILNNIHKYNLIFVGDNIVGCVLVVEHADGVLLDEIYIEPPFRNNGIGSSILTDILKINSVVYLWVYKNNKRAIDLYSRFGFTVIDQTETRFFMKKLS